MNDSVTVYGRFGQKITYIRLSGLITSFNDVSITKADHARWQIEREKTQNDGREQLDKAIEIAKNEDQSRSGENYAVISSVYGKSTIFKFSTLNKALEDIRSAYHYNTYRAIRLFILGQDDGVILDENGLDALRDILP